MPSAAFANVLRRIGISASSGGGLRFITGWTGLEDCSGDGDPLLVTVKFPQLTTFTDSTGIDTYVGDKALPDKSFTPSSEIGSGTNKMAIAGTWDTAPVHGERVFMSYAAGNLRHAAGVLGVEIVPDTSLSDWLGIDSNVDAAPAGWTYIGTHDATNHWVGDGVGLTVFKASTNAQIQLTGALDGSSDYQVEFEYSAVVSGQVNIASGVPTTGLLPKTVDVRDNIVVTSTANNAAFYNPVVGGDATLSHLSIKPITYALLEAFDIELVNCATVDYLTAAQVIRDGAGIPANQTVGYRGTPGLTDLSALTDVNGDLAISDAGLNDFLTQVGATGTGTELDPYLISDKRFNNSEGISIGLYISTTTAIYFEFYNCWLSGYDIATVRVSATNGTILFDQCLFTYDDTTSDPADSATNHIATNGGNATINITNSLLPSCGRTAIRALGAYTGTITLEDSAVNDTDASSTGAVTGIFENTSTGACTLNIKHCENTGTFTHIVRDTAAIALTLNLHNNDFSATTTIANVDVSPVSSQTKIVNIFYNDFKCPANHVINMTTCDGVAIKYNSFTGGTTNNRYIYFNGNSNLTLDNIDVSYNYFDGSLKTGGLNVEDVYYYRTGNTEVHHNWSENCKDDCYESVESLSGCSVHDNVGDNVAGQVVDNFGEHATLHGAIATYNIYGDCLTNGAVTTDRDGDTYTGIFVDTSGASGSPVAIINVGAAGLPANCVVTNPIMAEEFSGSGLRVGTSGTLGTGNTFDGVALS